MTQSSAQKVTSPELSTIPPTRQAFEAWEENVNASFPRNPLCDPNQADALTRIREVIAMLDAVEQREMHSDSCDMGVHYAYVLVMDALTWEIEHRKDCEAQYAERVAHGR